MDSTTRAAIAASRGAHYFDILRTVHFGNIALAAIIVFADTANYKIALGAVTIGLAVFGTLAGDSALKDLQNLRESMDEETAGSPFGKGQQGTPYGVFRVLSAAVIIIVALALLFSL